MLLGRFYLGKVVDLQPSLGSFCKFNMMEKLTFHNSRLIKRDVRACHGDLQPFVEYDWHVEEFKANATARCTFSLFTLFSQDK